SPDIALSPVSPRSEVASIVPTFWRPRHEDSAPERSVAESAWCVDKRDAPCSINERCASCARISESNFQMSLVVVLLLAFTAISLLVIRSYHRRRDVLYRIRR